MLAVLLLSLTLWRQWQPRRPWPPLYGRRLDVCPVPVGLHQRRTLGWQPVAKRNLAVPVGFNNQWLSLNDRACVRAWQVGPGPGRPHHVASTLCTWRSWRGASDVQIGPLITSQLTLSANEFTAFRRTRLQHTNEYRKINSVKSRYTPYTVQWASN